MKVNIFALILLFLITFRLNAQPISTVAWNFSNKRISGNEYELIFKASIKPNWYLYSQDISMAPPATTFYFKKNGGFKLIGNVIEESVYLKNYEPNFEMILKYFKNKAIFKQKVELIDRSSGNISGYISYMSANKTHCLPPSDIVFEFNLNLAADSIYKLITKIDAIEGYIDFINKYPTHPNAINVTNRLYEIMYAIAEEENDIASYYGFLIEFPKAQVLLRDKAFINMQMLEVEKSTTEYNENKSVNDDHELKERVARRLYIEAIRAKDVGDNYTFLRKYNTVLYSDLFKDTQAAFDLFRDKELAQLIRELRDEIRKNTYAIEKMTVAITSKLNEIQSNINSLQSTIASSQNDYSTYYERIIDIQREQANDWSNYVNTGKAPSGWFGSPKSY